MGLEIWAELTNKGFNLKNLILILSLVIGTSALAGERDHAHSYYLAPGEKATNYGQINESVYLDYHSTLINLGQINGDVICDQCKFVNYGQHNGRMLYR